MAVAVNISANELRDRGFFENVSTALEKSRLEPRCLELELTERVLMQHAESATGVLRALRDLGLHIAVDNFGTGYLSLSYLRNFPVDSLKIDQSFVREITADRDGAPIVSAVIGMAKVLGHRVTAEGVETPQQVACLTALGCDEAQGDYFSPALAGDAFEALLESAVPAHTL